MSDKSETPEAIERICDDIKDMLVAKNKAYGDSAIDPVRIFSKSDSLEQIRVRIDDKLNRIVRGREYGNEDVITDLIGYLVLYKVILEKNGPCKNTRSYTEV